LISLQWYVLVLTLRLAVYTLFRKAISNLGKNLLHPQKYALPYTYVAEILSGGLQGRRYYVGRTSGRDNFKLNDVKLAFCNLESSRIIACHSHLNWTQLLNCHSQSGP